MGITTKLSDRAWKQPIKSKMSILFSNNRASEPAKPGSLKRVVRHSKRNLAWAERELMKMQDEETDPALRALWSTAARIARERISNGKGKVPNDELKMEQTQTERRKLAGVALRKPGSCRRAF